MRNSREPLEPALVLPSDELVDLTLALRVMRDQAYRDGDLGAEYWQSISRLLVWANQMHSRLLEQRLRPDVDEE